MADTLSIDMACSGKPKEIWIDHLPAGMWSNKLTIRCRTGYLLFPIVIGQDMILPIELENGTSIPANWTQGIDHKWSVLAAWARTLEWQWQDINAVIQNLELRDANRHYLNKADNIWAQDLQIGDLALG